jgi:large subunit ribosomal protein L10
MPTAEKVHAVEELEERLKRAKVLVLTDFHGLSSGEMVELRRELKRHHLEYRVVKNRLAKLAAQRAGLPLDSLLVGPTGLCLGYEDPAVAFKLSVALAKKYARYKVKGGVIDGQLIDAQGVEELAQLPSREELLARLAAAWQGPMRGLAGTLNALVRSLVIALSEVAKVKAQQKTQTAQTETNNEEKGASETT